MVISLISEAVHVADILIRDVPESTVVEIDRRAAELGISRAEYLRRQLADIRPRVPVTVADLSRMGELASDLDDPGVMREAWS